MPKVAVIIPVYNVEEYLRQCMDSVVNQTLRDIEIICVDDGSTDGSLSILNDYAARDDRVKVIARQHENAGAARNAGYAVSRADYLLFLDSDDVFAPVMAESLYDAATTSGAEIAICGHVRFDGRLETPSLPTSVSKDFAAIRLPSEGGDCFNAFRGWAWDKLIARSLIARHGLAFQEQTALNDSFFTFTACCLARSLIRSPTVMVAHRNLPTSIESTRERAPRCFVNSLTAINEKLEQSGVWAKAPLLRKQFANYALRLVFWYLDTLKSTEAAKSAYSAIGPVFAEMNLPTDDPTFFSDEPNLYHRFRKIADGLDIVSFYRSERDDLLSERAQLTAKISQLESEIARAKSGPANTASGRFVSSSKLEALVLTRREKEHKKPQPLGSDDRTVRLVPHDACSGCGACLNKCPKDAIGMQDDGEGFLYPQIDAAKCVNCGLCLKACPVENPVSLHETPEAYAVWAADDVRLKSSSGGMFTLLADYVFGRGGQVCGAAYSEDYQSVLHMWARNAKELAPLRGSKYVQSDTGTTFRKAKELLDSGKWVLYTGCPCQIAGLYGFLRKDYPKLITADLVCHCSNSVLAYQSFLRGISKNREVEKVDFRDKKYFTWSTPTVVYFKDGTVYQAAWDKGSWYTGFLGGVINRMNCYKCPYARAERVGDFTLGDAWQVHRINPSFDDRKGTSLVFANSAKGRDILEKIRHPRRGIFGAKTSPMKLCEKIPLDEIRKYNGQLNKPTSMARDRRFFFSHLASLGYEKALWYGRGMRWDVGLVGWWFSSNHGSALTYYALGRILEDMGLSVILIPVAKPNKTPWEPAVKWSVDFLAKFFRIAKERPFNMMFEYNKFCDSFMLGSDQLWAAGYTNLVGYSFYLDFVEANKKKIAFSTSFGHANFNAPQDQIATIKDYLSRFDAISTREDSGVDICREAFGIEAQQVFDPVFLCPREYYDVIAADEPVPEKKYLFCYILDPTPEKEIAAKRIASKLGLDIYVAFGIREYESSVQKWHVGNVLPNITTDKFLHYIRNCSYMLTDSHHGTCFAIIYQRQYAALVNEARGRTRFDTVANGLGLEERLFEDAGEISKGERAFAKIDYDAVRMKLEPLTNYAMEWLKKALSMPAKANDETENTLRAAVKRGQFSI